MYLVLLKLLLSSPSVVAQPLPVAEAAVHELEALRQDVADVGQVQEHQGNAEDGVQDGHQLAPVGLGSDVAVTWKERKGM